MKIKYGIFLIFCLLLSFMFSIEALGCGCYGNPPGNCYQCVNGSWVQYGDCWGGCQCCYFCSNCWCTICEVIGGNLAGPDELYVGWDGMFVLTMNPSCGYCGIEWSGGGEPATQQGGTWFMTSWDTIGEKTVEVTTCCGWDFYKDVTVFMLDLDIKDVPDDEEANPGKYICVNNDDDDANGVPDRVNSGPVPNEDDLVEIDLSIEPALDTGFALLMPSYNPGNCPVKVWLAETKGAEITLPKVWDLSQEALPAKLYVEGYLAGDVGLRLSYNEPASQPDIVTFHVVNAEIIRPKGSLSAAKNPIASWIPTPPCYHFDFQGLINGATGTYNLTIQGNVAPIPPYGYKWTLDSSAGTLTNDTSSSPTHTAPASEGEGTLTLKAMNGAEESGFKDECEVKIYQDHLARDYANFETGGSCDTGWKVTTFNVEPQPVMSTWNCHGSVWHAYNGSGNGNSGSTVGWSQTFYFYPDATDWTNIESSLGRGDVVSFWGGSPGSYLLQHSHTCRGSSSQMYAANNEPSVNFDNNPPATWKWYECSSKEYFDAVNAASQTKWGFDFITLVRVHQKP